ncbi:hypothetical protein HJC06_29970 [Rhizobium sp. NLR9b]|uniref:hypothetical protein n=1 Tax=unclassified Rhizobium TaxID=2613769 RepID=UPI001C828C3A|nr:MULTISPECIES: hypothetical protein [unclassified Rhizobium]MBX5230578.1 hypothetical protein [Rhizobium sp. NLR9b]MBX5291246.1 hypothetical protein [Rhizobium sp. NLR10b]
MRFRVPDTSFLTTLSAAAALSTLCLVNFALYEMPVDISPPDASEERTIRPSATPALETKATVDLSTSPETLSRPVFSPTRREFLPVVVPITPPPEPVVAAPAVQLPAFRLEGIRKIGPDLSALLAVNTDAPSQWLPIGGTIEGWTIDRIDIDSVVLRAGDQQAVVNLYPAEGLDVRQN